MTQDSGLSTIDYRPSTILVSGGCGFIGTNLVKYLSEKGYKVRILDNLSTASPVWASNPHLTQQTLSTQPTKVSQLTQGTLDSGLPTLDLVVGDIRDRAVVEKAVEGIDAAVHLAAHTSVVESLENPEEDWGINVTGTFNLLEACRLEGVSKFIFASSNAVLGEQTPPVDETKLPKPLSPYGVSKLTGEALCSAYRHSFGLKTISLRFANCYGPYSEHKTSVITKFMKWAKERKPLIIYGDGNQTRDFIHGDDICQAIHLSLMTLDSRLRTHDSRLFQIGTGIETSINELAEMIKEVTADSRLSTSDRRLPTIHKPKRKGEIERNYSDISRARAIMGFKPQVELKRGLLRLWNYYELEKHAGDKGL